MDTILKLLNEKNNEPLSGMLFAKAQDIYTKFTFFKPLSSELQDSELNTRHFLFKLLNEQNFLDAIQFLAHGLSTKDSVSWAYQIIRSVQKENSPELGLVDNWLNDPSEKNCTLCGENAEKFNDPITWLRLAVFWSGKNISTQKDVKVVPDPNLTGHGVSTAIILTAARDPVRSKDCYAIFLRDGVSRALALIDETKEKA